MFQFFEVIGDIFGYFIGIIGDIVDLFAVSLRAAEYLFSVVYYLPSFFKIAILPFISLLVLLMVLNRGA